MIIKKIISSILAVAMVASISTTVFAEDVSTVSSDPTVVCVQTVTEQPLVGDDLLALAFEQSNPATFSTKTDQQLIATQLLETRTYSDDSIENDYSMTQFLLPAGVYAIDQAGYKEFMNGGYGVAITCRANYTSQVESWSDAPRFRLNNVTTTVQNTGTSIAATSGTIGYNIRNGGSSSTNFTCSPTFNPQSYSLYCSDSNFYDINPNDMTIMFFTTEVYSNNGGSVYGYQYVN